MTGLIKRNNYKVFVLSILLMAGIILFSTPSFAAKPLGAKCAGHYECASGRCDNRPASGCVPQDGTGKQNDFCSTHQQCLSQMCSIQSGKIAGKCTAANFQKLGAACMSHNECVSGRCDNRPGAGCVAQDGTGKPNDFCTTHQQCSSGFCQVTGGLRGTCSAGNQADGRPCRASSECASKYCVNGTCTQPKTSSQPPAAACPKKDFPGYAYKSEPSCAGVMGGYRQCDAKGYFCCASSYGSQSARCGGANKSEYRPDCSQWSTGGGTNVEPLVRDGIFYGCYVKTGN